MLRLLGIRTPASQMGSDRVFSADRIREANWRACRDAIAARLEAIASSDRLQVLTQPGDGHP